MCAKVNKDIMDSIGIERVDEIIDISNIVAHNVWERGGELQAALDRVAREFSGDELQVADSVVRLYFDDMDEVES